MDLTRLLPADPVRPRWSSASALVYLGAFVVLGATLALLGVLGDLHGNAALVGYSALACVVSIGLALGLQEQDRLVAAGVLATLAVLFFAFFVGSLEHWIGILDADIGDYQPGSLILEASTIAAALVALRRFRAPLLVLPVAVTFWIVLADLGSALSWGSAEESLSVLAGILLMLAGLAVDRARREAYGFWLHAVGGLAFGTGVLSLVEGDLGWVLVGVLSLAYVGIAYRLARSSYAVLGALGILATTTYFTFDAFSIVGSFLPFGSSEVEDGLDPWQIALSFVVAGLLIVLLGLLGDRLRSLWPDRDDQRRDRDELAPEA